MINNLDLTKGDGQVAAAAAAIVSWTGTESYRLNITFTNTSASLTETLLVTVLRDGGTARRIVRAVLAPNEQIIISGLPLDSGDTLKASATDATTVDYLVTVASDDALFQVTSYDASGAIKQVNTGVGGNQAIGGSLTVGTTLGLTSGASTAAAGTTTADAGALPAGTAAVYPTTAADDTKGVVIHTSDKVTGRTIHVGNGVSNKILKVYAPSGGTINGAAADAAVSSASGKGITLHCLSSSGNTWLAW